MLLTLDHLIIRTADPEATLKELSDHLGAPVLAEVEEVSGLASGIVRAGDIDIEVLRIGAEPPLQPQGYGLGFTADVPLAQAAAALREHGFATSSADAARPPVGAPGARSRSTACCPTPSRCRSAPASRAGSTS